MESSTPHAGLRSAAVFALGGLFALLAIGLALLSSGVYRDVAAAADDHYIHRTALSYLVNQIRRSDALGAVALGTFGEGDALCLTETVDGAEYITLLYCYEGQLRELYMEAGTGLSPEYGVAVLPLSGLDLSLEGSLVRLSVTTEEGLVHSAALSPRCGAEEVGEL